MTPGKMILLVDDDPATCTTLQTCLEGAGHRVRCAADGRQAFDRLRHGLAPDLILLDLVMPKMSGEEFRRRQLQDPALARIPVIVLSSFGDTADKVDGLGDVGYLQKPVEPDELFAAVQRFTLPRRPTVLVVEDEPMVRKLLEGALRHYGFSVRLAPGGRQAVELFRKEPAAVDLALLDVQMPELDGHQTLAALRQISPQVRCCFMSGDTGRYPTDDLLRQGALRVFPKPFRLAELTRELWQLSAPRGGT
jgi:CheY-like chemotaxis protein